MKGLKERWWKDMGLFMQNITLHVFHDASEGILNNIMGCNSFPTMGVPPRFKG
jgi:hypothetical protein